MSKYTFALILLICLMETARFANGEADIEVKILNNPGQDVSLEIDKALIFKCSGKLVDSEIDVTEMNFTKDGQLAIKMTKKSGGGTDVTYGEWKKEQIDDSSFESVKFKKTTVYLNGNYTCSIKYKKNGDEKEAQTETTLKLKIGAICNNNVKVGQGYGEDKNCNQNVEIPCHNTYPVPKFECSLISAATNAVLKTFKPITIRIRNSTEGLLDTIGVFSWNLKDLNLKTFDSKFSCSVKAGYYKQPQEQFKFKFPKSQFSEFQCAEPSKVGNGSYSVNNYDCFGKPMVGSIASYTCNKGHKLQGPPQIYCKYKTWSEKYSSSLSTVKCVVDEDYKPDNSVGNLQVSWIFIATTILFHCMK